MLYLDTVEVVLLALKNLHQERILVRACCLSLGLRRLHVLRLEGNIVHLVGGSVRRLLLDLVCDRLRG